MKHNYSALRARADLVRQMIVERARKVARESGLSPEYPFLHAHNAMVSHDGGNPWREVNYSGARKVLWLERKSWEASACIDRLYKRVGFNGFTFGA